MAISNIPSGDDFSTVLKTQDADRILAKAEELEKQDKLEVDQIVQLGNSLRISPYPNIEMTPKFDPFAFADLFADPFAFHHNEVSSQNIAGIERVKAFVDRVSREKKITELQWEVLTRVEEMATDSLYKVLCNNINELFHSNNWYLAGSSTPVTTLEYLHQRGQNATIDILLYDADRNRNYEIAYAICDFQIKNATEEMDKAARGLQYSAYCKARGEIVKLLSATRASTGECSRKIEELEAEMRNTVVFLPEQSPDYSAQGMALAAHFPERGNDKRGLLVQLFTEWLDAQLALQSMLPVSIGQIDLTRFDAEYHLRFQIPGKKFDLFEGTNGKAHLLIINGNQQLLLDREQKAFLKYNLIAPVLEGNDCEIIFLHHDTTKIEPDYWDRFNVATEWNNPSIQPLFSPKQSAFETYPKLIHPFMRDVANYLLQHECSSSKPVLLDVGAGAGHLAKLILKSLEESNRAVEYLFLENSEVSLKAAVDTLGGQIVPVKIDLVLNELNYSNVVDIALASGILTSKVLGSREEAVIVLQKVTASLKPNGFLLVSGAEGSWFTSDDFKAAGFEVLNTKIPGCMQYFYILKKI